MNTNQLSVVGASAIGLTESSDAAYTRRLFSSFYRVFAAERLPERAIFWVKRNDRYATVWHVRDVKNRDHPNDHLVGRTVNDDDAVCVTIGNWAAGCKMSNVRWEIYEDKDLCESPWVGRFDYFDLAAGIETEKRRWLASQDVQISGDWDFDCVIRMHICPNCGKAFNRQSILYLPDEPCDKCGKAPSADDSKRTITSLMSAFAHSLEKITLFPADNGDAEFPIQYLIDPIPNSVVYWLLTSCHGGYCHPNTQLLFGELSGKGGYHQHFEIALSRTLFNFVAVDAIRVLLSEYMRDRCGTTPDIVLSCWRTVGEALRTPEEVYKEKRNTDPHYGDRVDTAVRAVRNYFPALINEIVLQHLPEERI